MENINIYDGFSYNPTTKQTNPTSGYMVSIEGHERWVLPSDLDREVKQYIADTTPMHVHLPNLYVGCWFMDGAYCLDLSENVEDLDSAIALGKANNQIAIWDCAKGEAIKL